MSRRIPCLILCLLTVAVSGCTSIQSGSGVVIEEFTPGFSEVYPGEPVTFLLKFKNLGSVEATSVHAELLGLDEDWAASSQGLGRIVNGEMLPQETQCQYTGSGFSLTPPDLFYGTEGETGTCTWKYSAPEIPSGMGPTYDITARLYYNYRTDLVKSFTLASTDELLKLKQQGRGIPASTVSSTRSPVSIKAETIDPIRFWEGQITFPLKITISNTGGGMACLKGMCKKEGDGHEWNRLTLSIDSMSGQLDVDCFGYEDGGIIEVWPNRDNAIVCDILATDLSQITGYEERMLTISAEYGYFTDAGASVTIL
jgi:hypothetical protein